jgi:hypothetical protein
MFVCVCVCVCVLYTGAGGAGAAAVQLGAGARGAEQDRGLGHAGRRATLLGGARYTGDI